MTEYSTISSSTSATRRKRGRWLRYLIPGIALNGLIWLVALSAMKKPPTYSATWTVSLIGPSDVTNVNVPGYGAATSQEKSPLDNKASDPKEVYKFLAASDPVLTAAAAKLNMKKGQFGKPRLELIDNTTLMNFEMTGATPEEARNKAIAFYEALQARTNELRIQEAARQEQGIQMVLGNAKRKLEIAQERLSNYKVSSGLFSGDQLIQLSNSIEGIRARRIQLIGEQRQAMSSLRELSSDMKIVPAQVSDAFALKSDPVFQQHLQTYSDASALLVALSSKLGANHPSVIRERSRQEAAQSAMFARGAQILGHPLDQTSLAALNVGGGTSGTTSRDDLYKQVVLGQMNQQGLKDHVQELDRQIAQLEDRLHTLTERESSLAALNRDMQIAETVFTSSLARLDVSRSNVFGSYPPMQMITEPDLPDSPTTPNRKIILLGAVLASLLVTTGLVTLWYRGVWLQRFRRKKETQLAYATEPAFLATESRSESLDLGKNS